MSSSRSTSAAVPAGFTGVSNRLFERDSTTINSVNAADLYRILKAFLDRNREDLYKLNCANPKKARRAYHRLNKGFRNDYPHLLHRGWSGRNGKSFTDPVNGYSYSSKSASKEEELYVTGILNQIWDFFNELHINLQANLQRTTSTPTMNQATPGDAPATSSTLAPAAADASVPVAHVLGDAAPVNMTAPALNNTVPSVEATATIVEADIVSVDVATESIAATSEPLSDNDKATPVAEDAATSTTDKATPVTDETTPVSDEVRPVDDKATPVPDEAPSVTDEVTPVNDEPITASLNDVSHKHERSTSTATTEEQVKKPKVSSEQEDVDSMFDD